MILSDLHIEMLQAGKFHLDGWTSERGHEAADDLLAHGLVTCFTSGSDEEQYTAVNYTISDAGRVALLEQQQKEEPDG
jgi:hypothetical protein